MADTDKAPSKDSSKMKDKKKQKNNPGGVKVKDEPLVLTPSEKTLGILITQPKQKTIDTMSRLYAVPSEKLRVWTCWLTKVGERAEDWQWWLRTQIGLTIRISDQLQRAALALEKEKSDKLGQGDGEMSDAATAPEELETNATVPEVNDAESTEARPTSPEQEASVTTEQVPVELRDTALPEGGPGDIQQSEEVSVPKKSQGKGDKDQAKNKGKKTKGGKLEPKIMYKEGFWPIGVRWKPLSQKRGKRKQPPKRKPDEIPIPKNEEEMTMLIRKFKHQGVIYQSFSKHWSETAEQAVKQIVGRTVLPTKQVYINGEDVPYFFYLESEPDMNYAIEYDDEEVLLADPGRERITHEFEHLYFNLSDKPGKGGKPWI